MCNPAPRVVPNEGAQLLLYIGTVRNGAVMTSEAPFSANIQKLEGVQSFVQGVPSPYERTTVMTMIDRVQLDGKDGLIQQLIKRLASSGDCRPS